ncbi:chemotaxis protein CheB [uncultured Pseudoteredinibacter sp.]|uniref:chemotaxis protein CheB n=1 Tax=uncultured Pseudoteredinibacter sp. TaxID=1641701 RepID=UPI0026267AF5|nr:chemotaxis protein CheB [uncultured Pseudoteredinibacter sp.]
MKRNLQGLKLGVIANDDASLEGFNDLLAGLGCKSIFADTLSNIDWQGEINQLQADAWIVCVKDHDDDALADWLAEQSCALMLADEDIPKKDSASFGEWRQRWMQKLHKLRQGETQVARWPKQLWILGASTGGPEAVSEFLAALPDGLDAGFIYIQHSSVAGVPLIRQVVEKHSPYPVEIAEAGQAVAAGKVLMLGAKKRLLLNSQGMLEADGRAWASDFSPSIDQFVYSAATKVAAINSCQLGVIIFSGMAGDGAEACRFAQQRGAQIWVQSPESSISPYMPIAAAEIAEIEFSGSPKQLAKNISQQLSDVQVEVQAAERVENQAGEQIPAAKLDKVAS